MSGYSALITVMDKACRKAAVALRRDFGEVENLQVSRKGPADFVSQADHKAEATLKAELGHARPNFGFLMEESGEQAGAADAPRWIVDPLDGTTNFLHGIPHFAISIGVEQAGEIIAAMVYQPITDDVFWAERGRGAWVGNRRLRVSGRTELPEALFATGIPFLGHGDHGRFSETLNRVMGQVAGVRRYGAAALDLAWVAAGRFDGFWEAPLQPWDIAAGLLLIREAGGFVTDYRGGDSMMTSGEVVAGNPALHGRLLTLVKG